MTRVAWLDGLRGLAAVNSVVRHSFYMEPKSVFGFLFRSYWAEPREANCHIIELPPFRLLFASSSWVTCFMVLCGAAISIPVVRARNHSIAVADRDSWVGRLCSQVTRRVPRLYLPVILVSILSNILFYYNIFTYPQAIEMMANAWNIQPMTAPWAHIKFSLWQVVHLMTFVRYELDIANTFVRDDLEGVLNPQFWSIPVVFRGSLIVYLLLLTTGFWSSESRRLTFIAVGIYWFLLGQWDIFAFTSGLCIAEYLYGEPGGQNTKVHAQHSSSSVHMFCSYGNQVWNMMGSFASFNSFWRMAFLAAGLFLLSIPDDGPLGAEYSFLNAFAFSPWWDRVEIFNRCWTSLGAALLIITIANTPWLQSPLNTRPLQFLGRISYSLYVIHFAVYFILKWPLQNLFWFIITSEWYPGSEEASKQVTAFKYAWTGWFLSGFAIMIVLADISERYVERWLIGRGSDWGYGMAKKKT